MRKVRAPFICWTAIGRDGTIPSLCMRCQSLLRKPFACIIGSRPMKVTPKGVAHHAGVCSGMSWSPDSQLLAVTIRTPVSASFLATDMALITTSPLDTFCLHLCCGQGGQTLMLMCAGKGWVLCRQQSVPGLAAVQLALVPEEGDLWPGLC